MVERKEVAIPVPAADNSSMEEDKPLKKPPRELKDAPIKEELSEEDQELKDQLEMLVQRLKEPDTKLYNPSLETLRTLILTSTSSMTSVPKPLKYLRPLYHDMVAIHDSWPDNADKKFLADILSILAMTYDDDKLDTLKYRKLGSQNAIGSWGHEYVRHLSTEIGLEYERRQETEADTSDLIELALEVAPFFLAHNAEADAVDLLMQLDIMPKLVSFVDKNSYKRVCLYINSCVNYLESPDDIICLRTAHDIYMKHRKHAEALLVAIRMSDKELIRSIFDNCQDPLLKKQLAFMLARQQLSVETEDEDLQNCINNADLSKHFLNLARELDLMEPKTPEDIYKSHLEHKRSAGVAQVDSARQNLASTFVNAFVNAGFGVDKLMLTEEEDGGWIFKNKDHGMLSASASLGMILLWDVDAGLNQIDKYIYSEDENIRSGALLAIGIVNSGVRNLADPALAVLSEYLEDSKSITNRVAAIQGLGLAYAGSAREELSELLLPIVSNSNLAMELSSFAALALGQIFVGTCDGEITSTILQTMLERADGQLGETFSRFMGLGLGLLHLGSRNRCDVTLETLKAIEHPIGKRTSVIVEIAAYAGSGDVLHIQRMLHYCNDHIDTESGGDDEFQAYAVIGIALIAIGEDIGAEMALRSFTHLMHYGEPVIRKAVPLAIGLLCASNPVLSVLDTLGKYSHDTDIEVALNSIFAMGMVGAGTNNARVAQMLRHLASYYHKDASCLFVVRIAQGLLHMGKGTLTINPLNTDRQILSPVALAGLLTTLFAFIDVKTLILGRHHYLLYSLVTAMYPRFLITLNEELESEAVTVRVGQAVDVVGQAGRPKTITGFQTHSTPVLLAYSERAELSTEEYLAQAPVLEGFVLLKKNPDYVEETKA
ncbi:proteasome regulatory particle base subunit [Lobosporangium transversale]|uniref:26S proteasome regulatory subunit RPN1 n=1 Tax=Lobosporangium transversale TaxID=64571 RepID=A0A1Y2GAZ8_9FUNG|nr:26S proteasome regulatory complex non-ATPase subcomplex Rpn1 subunit [Lobosporangium transversale]KAF9914649.1 proteasome regulatory particle base subunit [Lobosporangium transversale]ORZ05926.1 26S proteasome regulatory complex non-ATPase subcomplex Rpn1 subunit [Lobosporangium transversale]|eukprot:XP_021877307.1 26S proteasome regulatory complex non-ATPase subcomplex Rpn1 subunit [Lobosporangium transversale]